MLIAPPNIKHLSRMYFELAKLGGRAVSEKCHWPYQPKNREELIVLASDMSRYDPRLFGILVEYLYFHWKEMNPYRLREALLQSITPQSLLVAFQFIEEEIKDPECQFYSLYLGQGYHPVAAQLFFLGLYEPGSHQMKKAAQQPINEFSMWGFLARERPIIHGTRRRLLGHYSVTARKNILFNLASKKKTLSISDYLQSIDYLVSRQQALTDLKSSSFLKKNGKGRSAVWVFTG